MNKLFPTLMFHHISMNVKNYDECLNFYLQLGMNIYSEWEWEADGYGYIKGDRSCFLDVGNGPCLELHEVRSENLDRGLVEHFCFHVDNVDAVYNKAIELGATPLYEPFDQQLMCRPKPVMHSRVAHVYGLAGEQIEIICWNGYSPYDD